MFSIEPESQRIPPAWRLILASLAVLPHGAMSRVLGRAADIPIPPRIRSRFLAAVARMLGVDVAEAELPLEAYPTLNAFFVRRLRSGARTWPSDPDKITSPVDGIVGQFGRIETGRLIQAKGHEYQVAELLNDPAEEPRFEGGWFVTLYLSPRHYHRIHTPCAGAISRAVYVPGTLYPVNVPAVLGVPKLFARNERLLCYLDSARGRIPVVAVGAYNVGRISAAFDPLWAGTGQEGWVTNRRIPPVLERIYQPPRPVAAGSELMAFHLGSTVVLLFEPGVVLRPDLRGELELRVGEPLEP